MRNRKGSRKSNCLSMLLPSAIKYKVIHNKNTISRTILWSEESRLFDINQRIQM